MTFEGYMNNANYPIDKFPGKLFAVASEINRNTSIPCEIIGHSIFNAISVASQSLADVELPIGGIVPVSLYLTLIAGSGEGKTPVDKIVNKVFFDYEKSLRGKYEKDGFSNEADIEAWHIEIDEKKLELKSALRKRAKAVNDSKLEKIDEDILKIKIDLSKILQRKPVDHNSSSCIRNDITIDALLECLRRQSSLSLSSDEGIGILDGRAMTDLGHINRLWDGSSITVDRISRGSYMIEDVRLTMGIMIQPEIFADIIAKKGRRFKSIGFLARNLIACPAPTRGYRKFTMEEKSWVALDVFHQRILDLLKMSAVEEDKSRRKRKIIEFSDEAKWIWIDVANKIEVEMSPMGFLKDITDYAAKAMNNIARIAALFHIFEGDGEIISVETARMAVDVYRWYLNEYTRLFSKKPELPLYVSDVNDLERFLQEWSILHPGNQAILRSLIAQYGPGHLRKSADRRENAINTLMQQGKIWHSVWNNKRFLHFNANYFPNSYLGYGRLQAGSTVLPSLNY
jgi:Protein of unknown function (DUF3987)